ncbi:hypothetical protein GCM10027516_18360 [Niabella aquatica]
MPVVFAQPWKGNKLGVDNKVPYPWVPLSLIETTGGFQVNCWGRLYIFDNISMLNNVSVLNDAILQQPVSLVCNNLSNWQPISKKIVKRAQNEVQLEIISSLKTKNGNVIRSKINVAISYDGLLFYKVDLSGPELNKEAIVLRIPLKKNLATLIHRWNYASVNNKQWWVSGKFPQKEQISYIPYFWIGNSEKGLFWFAESPNNWPNWNNKNAIEFNGAEAADVSSVVLKLANEGQIAATSWTFEFGLQATPVKPIPQQKRSWILSEASFATINTIWPDAGKPYQLKHYGYPEPNNWILFNKHIDSIKNRSRKAIVYNCLTYLSDASYEASQFKTYWDISARPDMGSDVKAYTGEFKRIDFTNELFQDFIVWKSNELLKKSKLDGFYLDNAMIENINAAKTVKTFSGKTDNSPFYPFMAERKLQERFYKMVKSAGKDKLVFIHSSSRIVPPILGFGDAYIDGEQFRHNAIQLQSDYLKATNLLAFQSEFSGKPFGLVGIFLPSFNEAYYKIAEPTRYLAAILLQHDITAWPIYSARVVWEEVYNTLTRFPGYINAEFLPYYSKNAIALQNRDFLISGYRNNVYEYLCVISNLSDKEVTSTVELSKVKLGTYKVNQLTSRGNIVLIDEHRLRVNVPARDFVICYLSKH